MSPLSGRLWALGQVESRAIRSLPEMAAGSKVLDLFGCNTFDVSAMKKKLPKPIKMVKFRPHDTERLAKVHRLGL